MVKNQNEIINIIIEYLEVLKENGINITRAYLFGSHCTGNAHKDSDIDLAVISDSFSDKLEDMTLLKLLTEDVNLDICPHPYSIDDFQKASKGSFLVEEIINKGIPVKL